MIPATIFEGREVAVYGLGPAGVVTARALVAGGADARCWDDDPVRRADAEAAGVTVEDLSARDWGPFAALVLTEPVTLSEPEPHRMVALARMTLTPVMGDVEVFARTLAECPDHERPTVIGITGTNGKSTTAALMGHVLEACGRDAQVAGDGDAPVLSLEPFHRGAVYVITLSAFQLELAGSLTLDAAVLLNLTPETGDAEENARYVDTRRRVFAGQGPDEAAIVCVDDPQTQRLTPTMAAASEGPRFVPVSAGRALSRGVHAVGGVLYDAIDGRAERVCDLNETRALRGRHNWQNAAAVYAAARAVGLDPRPIGDALIGFPGLPGRMEFVGVVDRAQFVCDARAANTAATRQALAAFETIYWIAGGDEPGGDLGDLTSLAPRVTRAFVYGDAAPAFIRAFTGRTMIERAPDLSAAVAAAAKAAAASDAPDPVVLYSPAARNPAGVADTFTGAVLALPNAAPLAAE